MKSYAGASSEPKIVLTTGKEFPRAPLPGTMHMLDADYPDVRPDLPWYPRGVYVFDGTNWARMGTSGFQRKASPIGSQAYEVEVPSLFSDEVLPTPKDGFELSQVVIHPSHRKSSFSGIATIWADINRLKPPKTMLNSDAIFENVGLLTLAIFRESYGVPPKMVALTASHLKRSEARSVSLSFVDLPFTNIPVTYSLRAYSNVAGELYINKSTKIAFNGMSQTAFVVSENT